MELQNDWLMTHDAGVCISQQDGTGSRVSAPATGRARWLRLPGASRGRPVGGQSSMQLMHAGADVVDFVGIAPRSRGFARHRFIIDQ